MNNVAAIVVTYNRKKMLEENIQALLKQEYESLDIYIIDNASTDGTEEVVKKYVQNNEQIKYINTGANLGGAGGFNYGVKQAIQNGSYKYVWIMDDDTIPYTNSLKELTDKAKILNDNFSFLCSYVQWTDKKPCKMNMPLINKSWYEEADKLENNLLKMNSCTFVSVLVNVDVIKESGLPVKEMFIYGDDHEFTERISKIKPGYLNFSSVVLHKMAANAGFDVTDIPADKIYRYFYDSRNRFYRAKKNGVKDVIIYLLWIPYTTIKIILKSPNHKLGRIAVILKGFFGGLFFNPKVEKI